jgi:putative ATPase
MKPLAEQMRPCGFSDVLGQDKVVSYLEKALPHIPSLLLYGPPGSGKTTIARVLAIKSGIAIRTLSAVSDGLPALRKILAEADEKSLLLFVDEIHRWNKAQQDALLPYVEDGRIILLGATTESPGHEINPALRSRMQLLRLEKLEEKDIISLIKRAEKERSFTITDRAREDVVLYAQGDARRALLLLDRALSLLDNSDVIDEEIIREASGERMPEYSRRGERDDIVSAWIKAMRAGDVEGALYFLARMEDGGEDPRFIARRMVVFASEDVGLASSAALAQAVAVADSVQYVGEPECWINLAHITAYLALVDKSWDSYRAFLRAKEIVASGKIIPAPESTQKANYQHPADSEEAETSFLPEKMKGKIFPGD